MVICENHAFHMLLHVRGRVVAAGGDPNTQRICCHCDVLKPFAEFCGDGNQCYSCLAARATVRRRARGIAPREQRQAAS